MRRTLERLWRREEGRSWGLGVLSWLLVPAEWAYRLTIWARNAAYDRAWLRSEPGALPSVAIGNLSVGGTGKTPLSAWVASELLRRGCRPAIVLRGYGGDEIGVHETLNPSVPVVADANRRAGIRRARSERADLAVLDDAFQHRALRADRYIVLVAAEEWTDVRRLLPRGPWREPTEALSRSDLIVVSRKVSSEARAKEVAGVVSGQFPELPVARVHLRLAGLAPYDPREGGLGTVVETPVTQCAVAVAGIARPKTLWPQLEELGVVAEQRWELLDHHRYSSRELKELQRLARQGPVIATLKDAVKLGAELEGAGRILVPVQEVRWESGERKVMELLDALVGLRPGVPS